MGRRIFPVTMPKWGIEMQQGTITEWRVSPGGSVEKGDHLLDVETDKIVSSVEAPVGGVLRLIVADKGATEYVGALIGVVAEPTVSEAEIQAFVREFKPADARFEVEAPAAADAARAPPRQPGPAPAPAPAPSEAETRVSPIARRVAERLGVDLSRVKGTGRDGRISKEDVEAYAASTSAQPAAIEPTRTKMTSMRAAIAKRLLESTHTIPHYRLEVDVACDALLAHRDRIKTPSAPVSVNDLVVRAAALALMRHPLLNSQLIGEEIHTLAHADICVAVATDNGLIAPVVRSAESRSAAELGAEIRVLMRRAREGSLTREEISGGSFTLSNLGMFGVDRFDAIINPPQVAILAVGAIVARVVARDAGPTVARLATLTLSADHRVVDGAVGARFLADLKRLIEDPASL